MRLNGVTVKRNITLSGGGSEIPWSIKKPNEGDLTVSGQTAMWLGAMLNRVGGV